MKRLIVESNLSLLINPIKTDSYFNCGQIWTRCKHLEYTVS